jgi:hypothetical protein
MKHEVFAQTALGWRTEGKLRRGRQGLLGEDYRRRKEQSGIYYMGGGSNSSEPLKGVEKLHQGIMRFMALRERRRI